MRFFLIIMVYVVTSFHSIGQSPNWSWANRAGGGFGDGANAIAIDASNNVYVTGDFYQNDIVFDTITLINAGEFDVYLAKYDEYGNVIWAQGFGGNGYDDVASVCTDSFGNVFVSGRFMSSSITFGGFTLTNTSGDSEMYVVKLDNTGNVLWANKYGANGSDNATSICTDPSGNIFLGGFYSSSLSFDGITLPNVGGNDIFIVKLDTNGNTIWAKGAGGAFSESVEGIASDASGNVCIVGQYDSPTISFDGASLTNASAGQADLFIVKYSQSGSVLWVKGAGGSSIDVAKSVATDTSDNIYVTGFFSSSSLSYDATILANNGVSGDVFVSKFDLSGNVVWAKSNGGIEHDEANSIALDALGNVYIGGAFSGPSILFGSTNLTNEGLFVAKYTNSGNSLWAKSSDSYGQSEVNAIAIDETNAVCLAGRFSNTTISFGSIVLTNSYSPFGTIGDAYVAKLNSPLGIEKIELSDELTIHPNPANSVATLQIDYKLINATLTIYNQKGCAVKQINNIYGDLFTLNCHDLTSGLYFVKLVQSNNSFEVLKLMIASN